MLKSPLTTFFRRHHRVTLLWLCMAWNCNIFHQAMKCWGKDQTVKPSFLYLLNKVTDSSLPHFHYFLLMFHYWSCLISVLVSLQNYSSLFVWPLPLMLAVFPIWTIVILSMDWECRWIIHHYPNSKRRVTKPGYLYGTKFCGLFPYCWCHSN